jgi:hypothetical protein
MRRLSVRIFVEFSQSVFHVGGRAEIKGVAPVISAIDLSSSANA